MEPRLGHDFSRVRIHAGERAGRAAGARGARVFATGSHVVFGRGEWAPATGGGRWLLAHELTHAVQQGGASAIGHAPSHQNSSIGAFDGIQRKPLPPAVSSTRKARLAARLMTNHGGLETKLPLTPQLLEWASAARGDEDAADEKNPESKLSPRDPSRFPEQPHPGVAFGWDEADDRPIDATHLSQGYLGDCYFVAPPAAIAETRPEFIEQMVKDNGDGSFTVSFFGPDGKRVHERVEPSFPSLGRNDPIYAPVRRHESGIRQRVVAQMLTEKA
jgi:hypothetical protein